MMTKRLTCLVGLVVSLTLVAGAQAGNPQNAASVSCSYTSYQDPSSLLWYINYSATVSGYKGNPDQIEFIYGDDYAGFAQYVDYAPPRYSDTNTGTSSTGQPTPPNNVRVDIVISKTHNGILWGSGLIPCQSG
jgi:hypothetical protein